MALHLRAKELTIFRDSFIWQLAAWAWAWAGVGVAGRWARRHAAPAVVGRFIFFRDLAFFGDSERSGFGLHDDDDDETGAPPLKPPGSSNRKSPKILSPFFLAILIILVILIHFFSRLGLVLDNDSGFGDTTTDGRNRAHPSPPFQEQKIAKNFTANLFWRF